jgi:hypothetical protein
MQTALVKLKIILHFAMNMFYFSMKNNRFYKYRSKCIGNVQLLNIKIVGAVFLYSGSFILYIFHYQLLVSLYYNSLFKHITNSIRQQKNNK